MGAATFVNSAMGPTAQDAINTLRDLDLTKKRRILMVEPHAGETTDQCIDRLLNEATSPLIDVWDGPAGCIDLGDGKYIFFGWEPAL